MPTLIPGGGVVNAVSQALETVVVTYCVAQGIHDQATFYANLDGFLSTGSNTGCSAAHLNIVKAIYKGLITIEP